VAEQSATGIFLCEENAVLIKRAKKMNSAVVGLIGDTDQEFRPDFKLYFAAANR
jgi:hypothetical protein